MIKDNENYACNILKEPIFFTYPKRYQEIREISKRNKNLKKRNRFSLINYPFCVYCLKTIKNPIIDHIIPISKGGKNGIKNLAISCFECNQDKKDQDLIIFLANRRIKMEEIKEIIRPINELEEKIVSDIDFRFGVMHGKSRPGHPEGKIIYHVRDVLNNINSLPISTEKNNLRLIALIHDTFKYKVDNTKAKFGDNHHGYFARKFAEKYIDDVRVLNIIQHHDEAYNAWQTGKRNGNWIKADSRLKDLLKILIKDDSIEIYKDFYYCDNNTGDKTQENFGWFVNRIKELNKK